MKKYIGTIFISSMASFVICLICKDRIDPSFSLVVIYPIIYGFFSMLLCNMLGKQRGGGRVTVSIFLVLQWLRNVLFPAAAAISGYLRIDGKLFDAGSASLASSICLYELVVTMMLCFFVLQFSKKKDTDWEFDYTLSGSKPVYWIYIVFAFALFLWRGRDMYSFLKLDLTGVNVSVSDDSANALLRTMIGYGLTFSVICIVNHLYVRYKDTGSRTYVWCCLVICLLRLCIISSDSSSRIAVIYSLGTFLLVLPRMFPRYKSVILLNLAIVSSVIIGMLTVYKLFNAFLYSSYSEAVIKHSDDMNAWSIASQINVNFYGVQNVARNLFVSKRLDLSAGNYLADVVQNIFGLKYLFRSNTLTTTAAYNMYIYDGRAVSGHLFSSIAHGAVYYSYLLCPLETVINILAGVFIENRLNMIKKLDSFFILCSVYIRGVMTMFACFPMALNYSSRTLAVGFLIIGFAALFARRGSAKEFAGYRRMDRYGGVKR
ncbi:MAG: hypothetical protein K6G56_03985 [Clostridiales bacterium]|nr:hypothetical protein [Clostridiales bacterium]